MPKITPFLWFDTQAEEAAEFYVSIFKNSNVGKVSRYGEAGPGKPGSATRVTDRAKADRAMKAMLKMKKIDIATLQRAYDGTG